MKLVGEHRMGSNARLSERSVARYNSGNRRFIEFAVANGVSRIKHITAAHVISYISTLEHKGCGVSYISAELAGIRKIIPAYSPAHRAKFPNHRYREEKAEAARWTSEQFFRAIDDMVHIDDMHWAVMNLGWFEGLRIDEALSVVTSEPRELQRMLRGGYVSVIGKGGKAREIPIFGAARLTISHLVDNFHNQPSVDRMSLGRDIQRIINARRAEWGADGKTFHGLRYSFAMHQFEEGMKLGLGAYGSALRVSNMLGHDDIHVTLTYIGVITL